MSRAPTPAALTGARPMALHMDLMLNGEQIGYLVARRLTPGRPTGEDICRYEWQLNVNGETRSSPSDTPLEHRFGDGAWALISRVIDAADRGPSVRATD